MLHLSWVPPILGARGLMNPRRVHKQKPNKTRGTRPLPPAQEGGAENKEAGLLRVPPRRVIESGRPLPPGGCVSELSRAANRVIKSPPHRRRPAAPGCRQNRIFNLRPLPPPPPPAVHLQPTANGRGETPSRRQPSLRFPEACEGIEASTHTARRRQPLEGRGLICFS